jgi:hypothetical protein
VNVELTTAWNGGNGLGGLSGTQSVVAALEKIKALVTFGTFP